MSEQIVFEQSTPKVSARILLADHYALIAEGLRKLLESSFEVIGVVQDGQALLEVAKRERPDLVITEISMPGLDGIEVTRELKRHDSSARVLILSVHTKPAWVRQAFEAGASGYLPKSSAPEELELAVREVLRGLVYVSPSVAAAVVPASDSPKSIRVLLVDDHAVVRAGTQMHFHGVNGIEIVGEAANGREAVEQAERLRPDVILMDLEMPEMGGVAATREILAHRPETRILIATASQVNEQVLSVDADFPAAHCAHGGETVLPPDVTRRLDAAPKADTEVLTPREMDAVRLVTEGLGNKEIAQRLGISLVTVRTHLSKVFQKLGLSNRVELAIYALRVGWAQLG